VVIVPESPDEGSVGAEKAKDQAVLLEAEEGAGNFLQLCVGVIGRLGFFLGNVGLKGACAAGEGTKSWRRRRWALCSSVSRQMQIELEKKGWI
jgi:hypothetical protein